MLMTRLTPAFFTAMLLVGSGCGDKTIPDVDYTCAIQQDCVAKNIGSCCGARLRCVNAEFEPDLEGVDEFCRNTTGTVECADTVEVTGCTCIDKRCRTMHNDEEI